jgi:5'-nucleotidase
VKSWSGDQPIPVTSDIPEDPLLRADFAAIAKPMQDVRGRVVGSLAAPLNGDREVVRKRESTMANVIADALLAAGKHEGAQLALLSGGSVRAGMNAGPVTYEEALSVQPFGNSLIILELTGKEIMQALEHGVGKWEEGEGRFLHVSQNVRYTFDLAKGPGSRVVSATIDGKPIDEQAKYLVAMNSFMAAGGDAFDVFKNAAGKRINEPEFDVDILMNYLKEHPQLSEANEGRITILHEK